MLKKGLVFAVIATIASLNSYAATINSSWIGGTSGDWETASNWNPAIVPENGANTFIVTIDGAGGWSLVGLTQNHTITKLYCLGEVDLVSGSWYNMNLTVLDGLTSNGDVGIDELDITGNVSNDTGGYLKFGEHLNIYGNLYNQSGASIEVFPHDIDVESGEVYNDGLIICSGISAIGETPHFHNNGQIQLYGGGANGAIFDNNSAGMIKGWGTVSGDQLHNKGEICAYGGSLAVGVVGAILNTGTLKNIPLSSLHLKAGEDVNNFGTIEVNAGGGVAFDCNLVNEPNGVINLRGGTLAATTLTQKAGATFEGFGTISGNVNIATDGLISLTGPTNVIGDVTVSAGATLRISDGQTLITGQTVNNGAIELVGGTVIFQGGYSGGGTIPVTAGIDRNHFDVNSDGIEDFKDFAGFAESWLWQASWY